MKYFFFDIDGTILNPRSGLISPLLIEAFKLLKAKGHRLFICTGRHKCILDPRIQDLAFDGYVLANGAYVIFEGKLIKEYYFPTKVIKQLVLDKNDDFIYYLEDAQNIYTNDLNNPLHLEFKNDWAIPDVYKDNLIDFNHHFHIGMFAYKNEDSFKRLSKDYPDIELIKHREYNSCDINVKGINKASGIKALIDYLNIDLKDTIAFGDGLNDLEMLELVHDSVAMGNAEAKLKEVAKYVTDDLDNDGVYKFLKRKGYLD